MDTRGRHLLVEYWGCDTGVLNDARSVEALMKRAADAAGATIVDTMFHRFSPQGVSGVVVIEESHLSIHTWPEVGYAAVDFYTCGDCQPERAHRLLRRELRPVRSERLRVERGIHPAGPSMVLDHHLDDRRDESSDSSRSEEAAEADPFRPGRSAAGFAGIDAPALA